MEQLFNLTNTPVSIIILAIISSFSGGITKKTWVILKESKLKVKFSVTRVHYDIESIFTKVLSKVYLFIGFIFTILTYLIVMISLFMLINICITWSIISYLTIGNYIPIVVYLMATIVGIIIEL